MPARLLMDTSATRVSGEKLIAMLNGSLLWLGAHREQLNAQNVYPVPDGDTGINLWLTLKAACQAVADSKQADIGSLWQRAAQGALEGSRGNSGVILSQFMKGMGETWQQEPYLSLAAFRRGLTTGSARAYAAVDNPQEGTILTVAHDVDAAAQSLSVDLSFEEFLAALVQEAQASVDRTPELLPILKQAGVVDAGGWGLALFLEGLLKGHRGEMPDPELMQDAKTEDQAVPMRFTQIPDQVYGFDIQFLLHQPRLDVDTIRAQVAAMGEYPLVDGDAHWVKVHLHVLDPGPILSWACRVGFITDVVVENMDAMAAMIQGQAEADRETAFTEGRISVVTPARSNETAVVAVSSTPGFSSLFASLGVNCLIECAASFNPSVRQFREAMVQAGGAQVILLPNNRNAVAAARQASADQSPGTVAVLDVPALPNGVAAMYGFEPACPWRRLVADMQAQADRIVHGSLARSARAVETPRGRAEVGHWVALAHGRDTIGGSALFREALSNLLDDFLLVEAERQRQDTYDLITVYRGVGADQAGDRILSTRLADDAGDFDVEWVDTRQPHHAYWLVLE